MNRGVEWCIHMKNIIQQRMDWFKYMNNFENVMLSETSWTHKKPCSVSFHLQIMSRQANPERESRQISGYLGWEEGMDMNA